MNTSKTLHCFIFTDPAYTLNSKISAFVTATFTPTRVPVRPLLRMCATVRVRETEVEKGVYVQRERGREAERERKRGRKRKRVRDRAVWIHGACQLSSVFSSTMRFRIPIRCAPVST